MKLLDKEVNVVGASVHNDNQVSVSILQEVGQNHIIGKVQNDVVLRWRDKGILTLNLRRRTPQTQALMKDPFSR